MTRSDKPRAKIIVNGTNKDGSQTKFELKNWLFFETDNNSYYQADTFKLSVRHDNADWWSNQKEVTCEIIANGTSLILGKVDHIDYQWSNRRIEVSGRDLTSLFIDDKITEAYRNQTASELVSTLAARHGMTAVIGKATTTKIGTYYTIDHVQTHEQRTEWDLLTWLAQLEEYVIYVKGSTLNFVPRAENRSIYPIKCTEPSGNNIYGIPNSNAISVDFSRSLTVAKGVIVIVKSWNSKAKKFFYAGYPSGYAAFIKPGQAQMGKNKQIYSYTIPGKTYDQALKIAESRHKEITAHEMNLSVTMPADEMLDPTFMIRISGTNTSFDQDYFVDNITRKMGFEDAYEMTIKAKNVNPDSQVLL